MSLSYKIEIQSEELKKKCFLRISSTGEIVFSSRIQLFELFKHHQVDHSGGQEVDQHGDHQGDDSVDGLDGNLGDDLAGHLGDDHPFLYARPVCPLNQTWPKVGPNI